MNHTDIRIRLVHERIEHFHSLPDTHAGAFPTFEISAGFDIKLYGLLLCMIFRKLVSTTSLISRSDGDLTMLLLVKILDAVAGSLILPKCCLVFC